MKLNTDEIRAVIKKSDEVCEYMSLVIQLCDAYDEAQKEIQRLLPFSKPCKICGHVTNHRSKKKR